ncbi:glucosyltransferase [Sistotremastrum niveocremeum HHB9708]|uniref:Dol-P-Glc:Glc(2)Man(9)GlcNAc(2)-PP-Dol alpha-1,2-glucosyltransferase n=1 Tax=Sistotremastrum niveocremeum HHB9708 TaxID=1314777 RepID=A0A164XP43_9AGAM|nr:glucosyltransferase [Sistotremastrum niveocremeum HHB9708]
MASPLYLAFCGIAVLTLKELNSWVTEPYMDEPFHIPQAQAYCRGEWTSWDPKITTPPGLYLLSLVLQKLFMLRCTLPMLRLTPLLSLLCLPLALNKLLSLHQRQPNHNNLLSPSPESIIVASFPISWFFGFLYYTEVPSLVSVLTTVVCAWNGDHGLAALVGFISCWFRQTNIIWVLYAYAYSQLALLRFQPTSEPKRLHDPMSLSASPGDLWKALVSIPRVIPVILPNFGPYALLIAAFVGFLFVNGGIVLGDKSNHVPVLHIPQMYYFFAFATAFGWPILFANGHKHLRREVFSRIRTAATIVITIIVAGTIQRYTIHHPFLLSDNRHYTFYVWQRIFRRHPVIPILVAPVYVICAVAWFVRIGEDQTLLQTLVLPAALVPTLLPTPLLEPRYFLIPYILLRCQVTSKSRWGLVIEGAWYSIINLATMWVFLYMERPGVGRFMW